MTPVLGIIASSNQQGRGGGPVGAYDALATVTLSASASSIVFAGIPAGYQHLQLRIFARSDHPSFAGVDGNLTFNGDTGANYSWHYLLGFGTGITSSGSANQSNIVPGIIASGGGSPANVFAASIIDILDYASTTKNKTTRALDGLEPNQSSGRDLRLSSGSWRNTAAITSLRLVTSPSQNFIANSSFALYGVK